MAGKTFMEELDDEELSYEKISQTVVVVVATCVRRL